jgi:DNA polymerase
LKTSTCVSTIAPPGSQTAFANACPFPVEDKAMQFDLFDQKMNKIMASKTYQEFKQDLLTLGCTRCELHRNRKNIVVDRGNPDTRIMLIGEGPGEQEDEQGMAFVGRAGQLLDKIMASIDLDTNQHMIICNVVKCRPPGNRTPHAGEVEACLPYLKKQISLVRPKVILLLGATALKHIDPSRKDFSMSKEAGRFFTLPEYPGIQFMVLYHPAALLYNTQLKPVMWQHVRRLRHYLVRERLGR